jgi:gluconate 2-dehydrogenase alpha chain
VTTTLPPVDAVLVGFGWTGAIMGQQLCDSGLNVVALERGPWRDTATDFATGFAQDELRYMWRHHLFQNVSDDTLTIRNNVNQDALPMRHLGSFLLGTGVGSGGVHWNGQIWRFLPTDFLTKSHNQQRYGKKSVSDYDLTVQDWGITYDELEPHYDQFDKLCGTSGKAGNLKGQIQPGGNPFEGPRSSEYPTPPMPTGPLCSARQRQNSGGIRFRTQPATCPRRTRIRLARKWEPALIAGSARNSAAATIPRQARKPRSCPT